MNWLGRARASNVKELYGYGTTQIIRKLKNFAGYRVRKHLVESLMLLKLDYCDTVYYPLLEFQQG